MIHHRNLHFPIDASIITAWKRKDPIAAVFYNSLSAIFPQGERFFIDSVRRYRDRLDDELADRVRDFIAQEATHSREHIAFNAQLAATGCDVASLEARTKHEIALMRARPKLVQLAHTAALEHFTAVMAHVVLSDDAHFASAPAQARQLWRWHAAEEIEHKSVAFDALTAVTASWLAFARWSFRCAVFFEAMWHLFRLVGLNLLDLRRQLGRNAFSIDEVAAFLLYKPGLLRAMALHLLAYLAPGFHPWKLRDLALAEATFADHSALGDSPYLVVEFNRG